MVKLRCDCCGREIESDLNPLDSSGDSILYCNECQSKGNHGWFYPVDEDEEEKEEDDEEEESDEDKEEEKEKEMKPSSKPYDFDKKTRFD